MVVDPKKLIAAIVPDVYCKKENRKEVKEIIKESLANNELDPYIKAAEKAELAETGYMDFDEVVRTPFDLGGITNPIEQHSLEYDISSQSLEQVYFFLHDYLYNPAEYGKGEKLVDNFISSPGSSNFSEMGLKASKMQEEGMKILGVANQLIKSILNLIYDLKEFKMLLLTYDEYKSDNKEKSRAAYISLKQRWLDQVDIKRGNTSIKALALTQANFVTLIDAFMALNSLEDLKKSELDLNERVKNLLRQRFPEFDKWLKESDRELRKRFEIEKIYLKSQVNTIKLYSRWAKPYLKAAAKLEQRATSTSDLVTAFNSSLFELVLMGISDYPPEKDIAAGNLSQSFKGSNKKKYSSVVIVELNFRSVPERFQQGGYGFRGKATIKFTSFCLNEEERKIFKNQIEYDDFKDVYKLISGATEESLEKLQDDINEFMDEDKKDEKAKSNPEDTNAFSALFSLVGDLFKKSPKAKDKKEDKDKVNLETKEDSPMEKVIRSQAGIEARKKCRKFYDNFKKANSSPTLP